MRVTHHLNPKQEIMRQQLLFSPDARITVATNTFIEVPIILQFEETPLIEVIEAEEVQRTTKIPVFHNDGTLLATVVGTQAHLTDAGKSAGVVMRHPDLMTVCELGGQTVFEIRRDEAAAIAISAELQSGDGTLVMFRDTDPVVNLSDSAGITTPSGGMLVENTFMRCRIGIHLRRDGGMGLGVR